MFIYTSQGYFAAQKSHFAVSEYSYCERQCFQIFNSKIICFCSSLARYLQSVHPNKQPFIFVNPQLIGLLGHLADFTSPLKWCSSTAKVLIETCDTPIRQAMSQAGSVCIELSNLYPNEAYSVEYNLTPASVQWSFAFEAFNLLLPFIHKLSSSLLFCYWLCGSKNFVKSITRL